MKRKRRSGLAAWLNETSTPVFVLNEHRVVLYFNHGCEVWTGWPAAEVIGKRCDFAAEPDATRVESLTGLLCPPPQVFSGESAALSGQLVPRDGRPQPVRVLFFPLESEAGSIDRILGVISGDAGRAPAADPAAPPAFDDSLHAVLAECRDRIRRRHNIRSLVGISPAMRRVMVQVQAARSGVTAVHLEGEPGTGREHVARIIHVSSPLADRAFIPLDCRRLPAFEVSRVVRRAIEAESDHESPAAVPHPGTLFLRDVDQLPRDVQQMLIERLGGPDPPLRLMSASAGPLAEAVRDDRLLPEVECLLTPLLIRIPPLRTRPEDVPLLAQFYLEEANRDSGKQVSGFSESAGRLLRKYNWPGNEAELAAVVREAHAACTGPLVTPEQLPFRFRTGLKAQAAGPSPPRPIRPLQELLDQVEAEHIRRALAAARNNKSVAADLLGINRPRLYRRMEALGISDEDPDGGDSATINDAPTP